MRDGLFPGFVLSGAVFGVVGLLIETFPEFALPSGAYPGDFRNLSNTGIGLYFPFILFALFYLTNRKRVALDRDYFRVAVSIFLGSLLAISFADLALNFWLTGFATDLGSLAGSSLNMALVDTVVGFSAALLSYMRRM